ncbi:MAG: glycosyltransferase family 4 protein [Gemmataceae bacterium]
MRVAIIAEVFLPKIDGVVHRTLNLIHQLQQKGDEVVVFCPAVEGERKSPVPLVEFPSFPFPMYPEYRIGIPNHKLITGIEEFAPDVLHYLNPFAFGFRCYDMLDKAQVRLPSVFSFHTLYGEFVKKYALLRPLSKVLWWLMKSYHNRADTNITVSGIMQDELVKRGFQRVEYWPPAVDGRLYHPTRKSAAMRERLLRGQTDKRLLLTVSRLAPEKNVGFLAGVLDQFPDACLAVVGDGPDRANLERQFAGKNAHFVGYLKGTDLAEAYASADAFLYASETETMGNVVLEAMACGCPVIAPRAGGIPSLIIDGVTGMMFQPGNLDDAVAITSRVLSDNAFRLGLSEAARQQVDGWDWEHSIGQVRRIYEESIDAFKTAQELELKPAKRAKLGRSLAKALTIGLVASFNTLAKKPKFRFKLPLKRTG